MSFSIYMGKDFQCLLAVSSSRILHNKKIRHFYSRESNWPLEQETLSLKVKASSGFFFFFSGVVQEALLHPRCNALDSENTTGSYSLHDTYSTEEQSQCFTLNIGIFLNGFKKKRKAQKEEML